MGNFKTGLVVAFCVFLSADGFFQGFDHSEEEEVTPTTLSQLKKALCDSTNSQGICNDVTPRTIIIDGEFDFTTSKGTKTEEGCYQQSSPAKCLTVGQKRLNVSNGCAGLTPTEVTYFAAGNTGLFVGSNKVIKGVNNGALKGRGLRLYQSQNVEIRDLKIHDINPDVIFGGDAIDLINVNNVLIDGCYIKNIGRQMIVTHYGPSTQVLIRNSVFDGRTPFAAYCDGAHYWLWLFLGQGDQITLQNNVIFNTAGRGPHLVGSNNAKNFVHIVQNTFWDVSHLGLIQLADDRSSVLIEGNLFNNVTNLVYQNGGNIFLPQTAADQALCGPYIGRKCLMNLIRESTGDQPVNSQETLEAIKSLSRVKPIIMEFSLLTKLLAYPENILTMIKELDVINHDITRF